MTGLDLISLDWSTAALGLLLPLNGTSPSLRYAGIHTRICVLINVPKFIEIFSCTYKNRFVTAGETGKGLAARDFTGVFLWRTNLFGTNLAQGSREKVGNIGNFKPMKNGQKAVFHWGNMVPER